MMILAWLAITETYGTLIQNFRSLYLQESYILKVIPKMELLQLYLKKRIVKVKVQSFIHLIMKKENGSTCVDMVLLDGTQ